MDKIFDRKDIQNCQFIELLYICILHYAQILSMKKRLTIFTILLALTCGAQQAAAQTYIKLNGLYALIGLINPAAEFTISPHSTFQTEIVISPWKEIGNNGKHMLFGIFMNEYRRYFRQHNDGWYLAGNIGMMAFDMSKPEFRGGKIQLENRYCKGYGFMAGLAVGYEYKFKERWLLDAYVGWSYMASWYNGYSLDGVIDMEPNRPTPPPNPDPWNGSAEWLPNKIGVSIGLLICDPHRKKR